MNFKSKADFQADSFNNVYAIALTATASAFSPNPERPPLLVDFPFRMENNMLVPNADSYTRFQAKPPVNMVAGYTGNL